MKKKLVALLTASVLATSLLAGCGNTNHPTEEASASAEATDVQAEEKNAVEEQGESAEGDQAEPADDGTSEEVKEVGTLSVSFPTGNIRIAIDILALQLGYFDEEGVTINPVNIMGNDALTAINEGSEQLDLLTVGFVPDLQALASGYDLTFIAGTAVEGGSLVAKKGNAANYQSDDKILDLDAIINAKIGFKRNEASWIVTRQYLLDNGVSDDDIKGIEDETNGSITYYGEELETAQAVQKGEVEIGFLPMEYALLYADAYDLEIIAATGDLQPNYVCCREVTSPAKLAEKKDAFVAYETARIRAWEYYKQGETDESIKENVVKIVSDYSGKETDYVETYLYGGVTKYSADPNAQGIAKYVLAAYNSGALSSAAIDFGTYDIAQNIDTTAYKTALDNLTAKDAENAFYKELQELYTASN